MRIGEYLRMNRERLGLTQKEVGEAIFGSSAQFVSNLERNENPLPVEFIPALCELFEVPQERLIALLGEDWRVRQEEKLPELRPALRKSIKQLKALSRERLGA